MNKLVKTVDKQQLAREFLLSLNGILKLTEKQINILLFLIKINPTLEIVDDCPESIISNRIRKLICKEVGVTQDNLCRHLTQFKQKGLIIPSKYDRKVFELNKAIIPELINDRVQITVILKV